MLHRDPVVVAASSCSLIRVLSQKFTDVDQRTYIARRWGRGACRVHRPIRSVPDQPPGSTGSSMCPTRSW